MKCVKNAACILSIRDALFPNPIPSISPAPIHQPTPLPSLHAASFVVLKREYFIQNISSVYINFCVHKKLLGL